jgi:hypothetical protein
LWSDSNSITLSKSFSDYLANEGIPFGEPPPYQHEENGNVERIHRPLRRLVTVLLHAGRPTIHMWAKAHAMAIYINITPKGGAKGNILPQHAWTNKKPGISALWVFGNPIP